MLLFLALIASIIYVYIAFIIPSDPEIKQAALESWEQSMLEGKSAGIKEEFLRTRTKELGVTPFDAAYNSKSGIIVKKDRNFIWGGGAWIVSGGLIGRIQRGNSSQVELYGRDVTKCVDTLLGCAPKERVYDFLLVMRDITTRKGEILREWVGFEYNPALIAELKYHDGIVTVHIMNTLKSDDVEEEVRLDS